MFIMLGIIINRYSFYSINLRDKFIFTLPTTHRIEQLYSHEALIDKAEFTCPVSNPYIFVLDTCEFYEDGFYFKYPTVFRITQQNFDSNEIEYHINFMDETGVSHGFFQVWSLEEDLSSFLKKSMDLSQQYIISFKTGPKKVNSLEGYYWSYGVQTSKGIIYRAYEVFLQKDSKIYRFSFFIQEDKWNSKYQKQISGIVNSFRLH